jgi:hypothetical protein
MLKGINNSAWVTVRENINISPKENLCYYEFGEHKAWFNEVSSEFLDERK